jgi:hypothetical protein
MLTEGRLGLDIDHEKVGDPKIETQPGKFTLAGEGLNVGSEGAEPVAYDYPGDMPGRSSAARSTRSSSTLPATPGSTSRKNSPQLSHATDAHALTNGNGRPLPAAHPDPDQELNHE